MARPPITDKPPITNVTAVLGQTVFEYDFLIQEEGQLTVQLVRLATPTVVEILVLGVDFTIPSTGILNTNGGTIVLDDIQFPTGLAAGDRVTLLREIDVKRVTGFPFRGRAGATQLNLEFDTVTLILQEQARDSKRALTLLPSDPLDEITIPLDRALKFWASDSLGNLIASSGSPPATVPVSTFGETLIASADAEVAQGVLELDAPRRQIEIALTSQVFG